MDPESHDAGRHLPLQRLLPAAVSLRFRDAVQRHRGHRRFEKSWHPSRPPSDALLRQESRRPHPGIRKKTERMLQKKSNRIFPNATILWILIDSSFDTLILW